MKISEKIALTVLLAIAFIMALGPVTAIASIFDTKFDVSTIETWCGRPVGTIRMIGAWAHDNNTFEDETGNLWKYDNVDKQAFYLLWIDDMNTPEIEDDEIIKIWQEKT